MRAKWKLFAFIFPVIFPVNREFGESRELAALSTAPLSSDLSSLPIDNLLITFS